jgi:hypothetical protein
VFSRTYTHREDGDWSSMLVSTAQDPDLIIMLCVLQDNDLSEFDESREIVQNLVDVGHGGKLCMLCIPGFWRLRIRLDIVD